MTTVYHITSDNNLPQIRKEGLKPMLGINSRNIGETVPAIHVFTTWETVEDALMNWDSMDWQETDEQGEPVLISILTLEIPSSMDKPNE